MKQFQLHSYQRQKNDVLFAFVMAAMFAISLVGAVSGAFDVVRGHSGADVAKARGQAVALRDPAHEPARIAPSGARK
jgi:hypothetical protein